MNNSRLNRILTIAAIVMVLIWARRFFGSAVRGTGGAPVSQAFSGGSTMSLLWIAIAIVCFGYLLWRLMSMLFWKKYFGDEEPPKDDSDD